MGESAVAGADKEDCRAELLAHRRTLVPAQIDAARTAVRIAVLARCDAAGWTTVAGYRPLRTEPGSLELLRELMLRGIRVLVPVTLPNRDLTWVALGAREPSERPAVPAGEQALARDLDSQPLGVGAISGVDAVLVPALAVTSDGIRLGRGGGSYDRALQRVPLGTPTAALLHDGEVRHWLPRDSWDVPVTAWVTPSAGWCDVAEP